MAFLFAVSNIGIMAPTYVMQFGFMRSNGERAVNYVVRCTKTLTNMKLLYVLFLPLLSVLDLIFNRFQFAFKPIS